MGSSPVEFKYFFFFFDLQVSLSLFLILCTIIIIIITKFTVILNLPRITAYVVNSHALPTVPVYKKNRIASLLCIFESIIDVLLRRPLLFVCCAAPLSMIGPSLSNEFFPKSQFECANKDMYRLI